MRRSTNGVTRRAAEEGIVELKPRREGIRNGNFVVYIGGYLSYMYMPSSPERDINPWYNVHVHVHVLQSYYRVHVRRIY